MATAIVSPKSILFLVNGEAVSRGGAAGGKTRAARLDGVSRSNTSPIRLEAAVGSDTVLLTIGTSGTSGTSGSSIQPDIKLYLHPENARDLLLAQVGAARLPGENGSEQLQVPTRLAWRTQEGNSTRGDFSDLVLKGMELLGFASQDALAKQTAEMAGQKLDSQVKEDVYLLRANELEKLKNSAAIDIPASTEPMLVFIHGTFSNTAAGFGDLWRRHPALVQKLFTHYGQRVYALDHATVMRSPIANAITLAKRLPLGARLHLVTHSRGGLVAEVLLRASHGIDADDLAIFQGEAYARHRQELSELADLLLQKQVKVERIVRVACPAHGTLLASNRLDAYLSALAWGLELAHLPVLPELVSFAKAVAHERTDPQSLCGIEAMRSNSAVIKWVNQLPKNKPNSQLRVVAGDLQADSFRSWVKTMLTDLYYWTDHDLVVQTSSMYGGMAREKPALFMLERSGKTDHFSYFLNDETANGTVRALIDDEPTGFNQIGPLSATGKDSSGTRSADSGTLPAVFVLPGILGSHLQRANIREWLEWWRLPGFIDRIDIKQTGITADGVIKLYYQDLIEHLEPHYNVIPFAFDWRISLEQSAKLLAQQIDAALALRQHTHQPVRIVAHSMGCIVVRVMQLRHPETWRKMMDHEAARVLMLGPPNQGSWAPLSIYTGDDNFGQLLTTVGGLFQEHKARQKIVEFPGLLQLQAGLNDPKWQLDDVQTWRQMAKRDQEAASDFFSWHNSLAQTENYDWAVPSATDLAQAVALRRELDRQAAQLQQDANKIAIVLGHAETTPCGIDWDDDGMVYLGTREGDGRVTWDAALLPNVPTWQVECEHGQLPAASAWFAGYTELLESGDTQALPRFSPTRGASAQTAKAQPLVRLRKQAAKDLAFGRDALPLDQKSLLAAAMGAGQFSTISSINQYHKAGKSSLQAEVVHGDVRFVNHVLLLGHSRSLRLTGTEQVANQLLGNALQEALDMNDYPTELGQHQLFTNRYQDPNNPFVPPNPPAVMIIGMGDEGDLQPNQLSDAVRQATLDLQRHCADPNTSSTLILASTSVGSGGSLSVSQAVTALVQGVMQANARIVASNAKTCWPLITKLLIVELHQNRALEAWQALNALPDFEMQNLTLLPHIRRMEGQRSAPQGGLYRSTSEDRIRISEMIVCQHHETPRTMADGGTQNEVKANRVTLEFSVQTRRARTEVQGKNTQSSLINALVLAAENKTRYDVDLARTLFQLLVPQEIKPYLGSANTLLLEVDSKTACYPWEMLEDSLQSTIHKPWALRISGALLRKMSVSKYRRHPTDAPGDAVLVIGEPLLNPSQNFAALPGARAEAEAVDELFANQSTLVLGADFLRITTALLAKPWKIVHLAGHGQYDPKGERSGMIMSNDHLLSPTEFESMDTVPELVFVNCCHLGKSGPQGDRHYALFAANVAEQLILNGVRCVVAAGWAVDDAAAKAFAITFYKVLLKNESFAEAVRQARKAAWECNPNSNTWAAYQCYGDPAWTLNRSGQQVVNQFSKTPILPTENELVFALQSIQADANCANEEQQSELCNYLEKLISVALDEWKNQGRIAEAIGLAWRDLNQKHKALAWLKRAIQATDGTASLAATEQQLNIAARASGSIEDIAPLIDQMNVLAGFAPTAERWSILGSAYKRQAILWTQAEPVKLENYLEKMADAYGKAAELKAADRHYPLMQHGMAQLRLHWMKHPGASIPNASVITEIRQALEQQSNKKPDFWSEVGKHEVTLFEGVLKQDLASRIEGIVRGLEVVHLRVSNRHYWDSVHKTAEFMLVHYMKEMEHNQTEMAAAKRYLAVVSAFG